MSTFAPVAFHSLSDTFNDMIAAADCTDEAYVNTEVKHIFVSPEDIAYLNADLHRCCSAAFKDPFVVQQEA